MYWNYGSILRTSGDKQASVRQQIGLSAQLWFPAVDEQTIVPLFNGKGWTALLLQRFILEDAGPSLILQLFNRYGVGGLGRQNRKPSLYIWRNRNKSGGNAEKTTSGWWRRFQMSVCSKICIAGNFLFPFPVTIWQNKCTSIYNQLRDQNRLRSLCQYLVLPIF